MCRFTLTIAGLGLDDKAVGLQCSLQNSPLKEIQSARKYQDKHEFDIALKIS